MKTLLFLCLFALSYGSIEDAMLVISGASCIEELTEDAVSMFEHYAEHPIDLNAASERKLVSSGLMSSYQAASLCEYRKRSGDVLSWQELAFVDGFSGQYARALESFAVLRQRGVPGAAEADGIRGDITLFGGASIPTAATISDKESVLFKYGLRAALKFKGKYELMWNTRTTFSSPKLGIGTISAGWEGRRGKLILGHYNSRFGQGLVSWSGFKLSGFSSMSAFSRNGSGVSPTSSAAAELMGIAGSLYIGHGELNAGISVPTKDALINYSFYRKRYNAGATISTKGVSLSERISLRHFSIFSELAWSYSGGPAVEGGVLWVPVYGVSLALNGRYHSPGWNKYSGIAFGAEGKGIFFSLDYSSNPVRKKERLKAVLTAGKEFSAGEWVLKPIFGTSVTKAFGADDNCRTDLRLDILSQCRMWRMNVRGNALFGNSFAWLAYLETAAVTGSFSAYLRMTGFDVKQWNDRIYSYERNAPGNFSIPAYYGKGANVSAYVAMKAGGGKTRCRHHVWIRAEYTLYFKGSARRTSGAGCVLQYKFQF